MRKRGKPFSRACAIPGMVAQQLDVRYELRLRQCIEAFRRGAADADHHADLADCRDLILLAVKSGHCLHDTSSTPVLDLAGVALTNILERAIEKKRWGCTGDEIRALELLMDYSLDWWNRRSGALYYDAYTRLKKIRIKQSEQLKAIALDSKEIQHEQRRNRASEKEKLDDVHHRSPHPQRPDSRPGDQG